MLSFVASFKTSSLGRAARRIGHDERGDVAIVFAMSLIALCLMVGAAVDIGRWLQARHQTIAAMDAAVLAGGRVLQLDSTNVDGAKAAAARYYTENTKMRTPVIRDTVAFNAIDNNTSFVASGNAFIRTSFLGLANITELPLLATTAVNYPKAQIAIGGQQGGQHNNPIEISLMLDVTGSMKDTKNAQKITALKAAAVDLVNIVIRDGVEYNPARVAIVPFAEGVRLPSSVNTKARGTPANSVTVSGTKYYPTECVVERTGTNKYTDVAPGAGNYVMTMFNNEGRNAKSGVCGLSADDELLPLTSDKTTLVAKINNLDLAGQTAGQVGTAWAWYTLSPNWNTLWPAASAAGAYGDDVQKYAVLMTDGEYNQQYDSKGVSSNSGANGISATQATSLCTEMKKKKNLTLFAVGFAIGGNQTAINTLNSCSTSGVAFTADSADELKQVFRYIGLKISQLYLTQ